MAVEFGVLIPTREVVMSGRPETGPLLVMAERAEAAGFDSVWVGDSLTARPRHEPLTLMSAIAARTRRVRIGTGVLLPALRPPVVLAHVIGTLDRVAEGRVILGVGIAADAPAIRKEFAAAGAAYLTLALDPDTAAAQTRMDRFLETYYAAPAKVIKARQAGYAGPIEGGVEWIQRWIDAGARHIALRFAGGDQLAQVDEAATRLLPRLKRR